MWQRYTSGPNWNRKTYLSCAWTKFHFIAGIPEFVILCYLVVGPVRLNQVQLSTSCSRPARNNIRCGVIRARTQNRAREASFKCLNHDERVKAVVEA
jgi:hypothetical protein